MVWVGIYDAALQHEPPKSFRHAFVVLVVAIALYFPFLGFSGFAHSEGFRVYPGWEMLEGGDWVVPHLFGQVYLRRGSSGRTSLWPGGCRALPSSRCAC